jgi:hypothetical protein
LVEGWHRERRTVAAVLHDLDQVRAHFPDTLLIARECVAWGATLEVVTPDNLRQARRMSEAWSAEPRTASAFPCEPRSRIGFQLMVVQYHPPSHLPAALQIAQRCARLGCRPRLEWDRRHLACLNEGEQLPQILERTEVIILNGNSTVSAELVVHFRGAWF